MDGPVASAEQMADLLQVAMTANGEIAAEAPRIAEAGELVCQGLVDRLTTLGQRVRPAALARVRPGSVDPALLRARARWMGSAA